MLWAVIILQTVCREPLGVLAAPLWFQSLLVQHVCLSQLSLSQLAPLELGRELPPQGHKSDATGRRVDVKAPSDGMKELHVKSDTVGSVALLRMRKSPVPAPAGPGLSSPKGLAQSLLCDS